MLCATVNAQKKLNHSNKERGGYEIFVGLVGNPMVIEDIKWDDEQMEDLKELGVNMVQLSLAWGGKPGGEVINIEDLDEDSTQMDKWKFRVKQCVKHGMKPLAHFGIPRMLNMATYKPACITNKVVIAKYDGLIRKFMKNFPEVNDILVYTYDQQAWLCSEFGPCPRCTGIPLHDRLPGFLNMINTAMKESRSKDTKTTLWWKPWEISKGQTINIMKRLNHENFGLMLNSSTSNEVYPFNDGSFSSDLGLRRLVQYAYENNIPVVGEFDHTLYKPLYQIDDYFPRLIYEQMKGWKDMKGVVGIKEYYGFAPSTYSVNFAMLEAWLKNPDASVDTLLKQIAKPYGKKSSEYMIEAWDYIAQGVVAYPWDVTYLIGPLGLQRGGGVSHPWNYVKIMNGTWDTPIWEANRRANFMMTDTKVAHPWIFEDAGLRLEDAAELNFKAVKTFDKAIVQNEGMTQEIKKQRDFIEVTAKALKAKGLHFALTIASQNARTVSADKEQFEKVCKRIKFLLQEDINNGFTEAKEKLRQFEQNPSKWLNENFATHTWQSFAEPNWSKWITPE
ncbi:hypothetical protein GCM10022396_20970 [Flavivirga amylovorans]